MNAIVALILLAVGALLGYAYFRHRQQASERLITDQDFLDCQADSAGKPNPNAEVVFCYVDKKTKKIKQQLDMVD